MYKKIFPHGCWNFFFFFFVGELFNAGICISGIRPASGGVNSPKWTSSRFWSISAVYSIHSIHSIHSTHSIHHTQGGNSLCGRRRRTVRVFRDFFQPRSVRSFDSASRLRSTVGSHMGMQEWRRANRGSGKTKIKNVFMHHP